MKSIRYLVMILLLLFPNIVFADDFYGFSWGDSKEKIKAGENLELLDEEQNKLMLEGELIGEEATFFFTFDNNQLISGAAMFKGRNDVRFDENKNAYTNNYLILKKLLIKKYGKAYVQENNTYRWKTKRSKIYLNLTNFDGSMFLLYEDAVFIDSEKEKENKFLDKL